MADKMHGVSFWIETDTIGSDLLSDLSVDKAEELTMAQVFDLCILKWQLVKHWLAYTSGARINVHGSKTCALCHLYVLQNEEGSCIGCPVSNKYHTEGCGDTPHSTWMRLEYATDRLAEKLDAVDGIIKALEELRGEHNLPQHNFYLTNGVVNVEPPIMGQRLTRAQALELSIKKWRFILSALLTRNQTLVSDGGKRTCALCQKYHLGSRCSQECPVAGDGHQMCAGTPYRMLSSDDTLEEQILAASREVVYLESLRDE